MSEFTSALSNGQQLFFMKCYIKISKIPISRKLGWIIDTCIIHISLDGENILTYSFIYISMFSYSRLITVALQERHGVSIWPQFGCLFKVLFGIPTKKMSQFCITVPFQGNAPDGRWILTPHYSDVIMGTIASQIISLAIVYSTVHSAQIKENIKAPRHWPLYWELTGDGWIPHTKGQ